MQATGGGDGRGWKGEGGKGPGLDKSPKTSIICTSRTSHPSIHTGACASGDSPRRSTQSPSTYLRRDADEGAPTAMQKLERRGRSQWGPPSQTALEECKRWKLRQRANRKHHRAASTPSRPLLPRMSTVDRDGACRPATVWLR
jgi:hypothetical protein